ncbi:MAG: hypothetical protein KAS87_04145 [Candidatus Omnitrophica bacterium]|nr:hypothetical protein [Candidatus Omnitrophota bacterium]
MIQVSGKNLTPEATNPLIRRYDERLKNLVVEEERNDGKIFKASVCDVDARRHELIDKNTLILSRQVKFDVYNPFPHDTNNNEHSIHVRIHKALMEMKVEAGGSYADKRMTIEAIDSHVAGDFKKGRWPRDRFDGAGF